MKYIKYKKYCMAFSEVDYIIENSDIAIQEKIPNKLKLLIKKYKDIKYNQNIIEKINKNQLMPETKAIIGLIYRDYLCDKKEKIKENNYEIIFKGKKKIETKDTMLVPINTEKEKWYNKILSKIKMLFRRNGNGRK